MNKYNTTETDSQIENNLDVAKGEDGWGMGK